MASTAPDEFLLERDDAHEALGADLARAKLGAGRIALVIGEAGAGKTSLVRSFTQRHDGGARVLWASCERHFMPQPLRPVYEIVHGIGDWPLEGPIFDVDRSVLLETLLDELRTKPTICVFEDVDVADEATLDALAYLGRQIDSAPSLLVWTYRDDELGADYPLRRLLGELPSGSATAVSVLPLSTGAVEVLAQQAGRSAHGLHEATGGNPFFVMEVLAGEGGDIPRTVGDAVVARTARLSDPARRLLGAIAVVPGSVEIWLAEKLAQDDFSHLAECLASGILIPTGDGLGFRHELARLAVEATLAPDRRSALNETAFRALECQPDDT